MDQQSPFLKGKILIAGAHGMVGSALVKVLRQRGCTTLLTPTRQELNYLDQARVHGFLHQEKPDSVIVAAAKVGGIEANRCYPAEFMYENLMIACNLIHGAHAASVSQLLYLGSSCIYPRLSPQPIVEEALLTAPLEETNEAYALAKIAALKMCAFYRQQYGRHYFTAMPTNLYGPGDRYHPENSHVIPALMLRLHQAKQEGHSSVVVWGTGQVLREFLYVEDLAEACLLLLQAPEPPTTHINIGSEEEVSIATVASWIAEVVGYSGTLLYDPSKPEGTPRKKSSLDKIHALGWRATTSLKEGLSKTYQDFLQRTSL